LPRQIDPDWFTRNDSKLARAEQTLADAILNFELGAAAERDALAQAAFSAAVEFMIVSVGLGKELMAESDVEERLELLRFAAVKLWDWSRRVNGYPESHHGTPDRGPAYPYEVGFVLFEAAKGRDTTIPDLFEQTLSWWWTQLAVYPGRGYSTGQRPLNFKDVLEAAERAKGARPAQIAFLHLYGSWEESQGTLIDLWHTGDGPVRLLEVPMRTLEGPDIETLLRRFLAQEALYLKGPNAKELDQRHHSELARAWQIGCPKLSAEQRTALQMIAPAAVAPDIEPCL
jgi:hypothetical protein